MTKRRRRKVKVPPLTNEFANALHLALEVGVIEPLRSYVAAGKPVPHDVVLPVYRSMPQSMARLVAELLGHELVTEPTQLGRPRRVASKATLTEQAERNAAWATAFALRQWRIDHHCRRVPRSVKVKFIEAARRDAAKAFGVPLGAIFERNIENLLKSARIAVR